MSSCSRWISNASLDTLNPYSRLNTPPAPLELLI